MNDQFAEILGLNNISLLDEVDGIGRYGDIEELDFQDLIKFIKSKLNVNSVKVIGNDTKKVSRIGISGGSGSKHMYQAKYRGCDVYLTGDVTYHTALDAISAGITVIDIGHHAEKIFIKAVDEELSRQFADIEFIESLENTDPYKNY